MPFWLSQVRLRQVAIDLKGRGIRSTHLFSTRRKYLFSVSSNQFIVSYKYPQFMLQLNSNNQIVLLYYYDNKKQTTIVNGSQLRLNDTNIIRWLVAFYYRNNTVIQFGCLSWVVTWIVDTYTKTINWLLVTEKRYFRLVEKRCVERMPLPFKSIATCLGLTSLDQKGIFGSGPVSTDVAGKR